MAPGVMASSGIVSVITFPQVLSGTVSGSVDSNSTSHSVTLPTGTQVGDLIVVFFGCDGSDVLTINTSVSGNNWTMEDSSKYEAGDFLSAGILWKVAEGSDTLQITSESLENHSWVSYRLSDYYSSNPLTITKAQPGSSTANADPPSNTGGYSTSKYLWFVAAFLDDNQVTGVPTDFGNEVAYTPSGSAPPISTTRREYEFGSAYDPDAFTSVSDQWLTFTVIVNPEQ